MLIVNCNRVATYSKLIMRIYTSNIYIVFCHCFRYFLDNNAHNFLHCVFSYKCNKFSGVMNVFASVKSKLSLYNKRDFFCNLRRMCRLKSGESRASQFILYLDIHNCY